MIGANFVLASDGLFVYYYHVCPDHRTLGVGVSLCLVFQLPQYVHAVVAPLESVMGLGRRGW